jgi:molecular chaperone DnaK
VYQGERAMAQHNRLLGVFQLGNIPPAPRGIPQIEVTFDIDANGILNAVAKDKATNNEQKITITSSSGLSKDEVDKMAKDAESHAAEDRTQRDTIETRNRGDAMIYNVEKTLKEHRSKISDEEAKNIEEAIEETRKAMQGTDAGVINAAIDKLTAASHKLAEAMYKSASGPGGTPPGGGQGPGTDGGSGGGDKKKDDVVDAEFVDVDDKKYEGDGWLVVGSRLWVLEAGRRLGCLHGVRRNP